MCSFFDPPWRLFVGLLLPKTLSTVLQQAQASLRTQPLAVRWTPAANLHLTLHFLGDVPQQQVPALAAALTDAWPGHTAPRLRFTLLGAFPSLRQPQVIWAGMTLPEPALLALHQASAAALKALGQSLDPRPFHPHATLGYTRRDATVTQQQTLSAALKMPWPGSPAHPASELALLRSELHPTGRVYTPIAAWTLPIHQ